jgi:transcription elongation factor Elf1
MRKSIQHSEVILIGDKFKCPHCSGKGKSVRASKPKFKTIYEKQGNCVSLFRTSLIQCKRCETPYAIREKQNAESWLFDSYQDFIVYQAMEEDYTAPVYMGSTGSEWTKRQASGIQLHSFH